MSGYKFTKPPLLPSEKEKKMDEFMEKGRHQSKENMKKEPMVQIHLRITESLWQDIKELTCRTGLSLNAICLTALHSEIKKQLKENREV